MSLRRLGIPVDDQILKEQLKADADESLLKEIKRLNDYMALMTNEPSPSDEQDDTDATT